MLAAPRLPGRPRAAAAAPRPAASRQPSILDEALPPGAAAPDELADRQRVEELVGQDDGRAWRQRLDPVVPVRAPAAAGPGRRAGRARSPPDAPEGRRGSRASPRRRRAAHRPSACRGRAPAPPAAPASGRPMSCQVTAAQSPRHSPKAWEISGAVVKSPAAAEGVAAGVIGRGGPRHEGVEALGRESLRQTAARAGFARSISQAPTSDHRHARATAPSWRRRRGSRGRHPAGGRTRRCRGPRRSRPGRRRRRSRGGPGSTAAAHQHLQQDEQHHALQPGLVELARMARLRPAIREDHAPGHVGDPAPQLAIDEIGQPAEAQADRHHRRHPVAEGKRVELLLPAEQQSATMTPSAPPWKLMPPCQTARISSGWNR